jgi:hypothetical protein
VGAPWGCARCITGWSGLGREGARQPIQERTQGYGDPGLRQVRTAETQRIIDRAERPVGHSEACHFPEVSDFLEGG